MDLKARIAEKALPFIRPHMVVGLGSGTTAAHFIQALGRSRLPIRTVASSFASESLARSSGLHPEPLESFESVDITVDGADEIDPHNRLIKGAGGAHTREKILAHASKQLLIIAESSKRVAQLGRGKIPVEVLPYGHLQTAKHLATFGCSVTWRSGITTDNGNLLLDLQFSNPPASVDLLETSLLQIPGVVETGLFLRLPCPILVLTD
jgi:ribose 5-phosphate isomerase A